MKASHIASAAVLSCLIAAHSGAQAPIGPARAAASPWPVSSPSREGLAPAPLTEMVDWMRGSRLEFHSLVIVKNGKLVVSLGFNPFEPETPQEIYSCTKSFLSTLVGIAIDEGLFPSLESRVADYLTEYDFGESADPRRRVTFEQLMSQSSGFPPVLSWDFERVVDTERYVLHRDLVAEPGTRFIYNSGTLNLVSAALQKAVGMKAAEYARLRLFEPLGIRVWAWPGDGTGVTTGGTKLCLSALDLAKLGYLYLRGGDWFGRRVLPAEWIARATASRWKPSNMNRAEDFGYGLLWWVDEWGGFSAHGSGGQFCFVVPELDLVAVFTASLGADRFPIPYDLMKRHVLASAAAGRSAAPDPAGDAALAARAAELAPRRHEAGPLPAIAARIAGARFACENNPLGLDYFILDFPEPGAARVVTRNTGEFSEPVSFSAGMRGGFLVGMTERGGMAAKADWAGERSLRLSTFDMKGLVEFSLDFGEAGAALVRARSPAYGIDAVWRALPGSR
jgi:CubicO group peptidase (beta-lactamase class C family)